MKNTRTEQNIGDDNEDNSWTPFWRQLLVCSGVWPSFYLVGLCIGAPTVFVPQMRREANSTDVVSDDMVSWLSSATHYSAVPWVFILTVSSQIFGRKKTMLFVTASSVLAFSIFYFSENFVHLFISEALVGISSAAQLSTSILVLTEYVSPQYRGVFLTIKSASMFWGIWTSNVIGTFLYWKNIGIVGIVCSVYALFTVFFWPESSYWLAYKRRFEECAKSHRWLKSTDKNSEEELSKLLSILPAQKQRFTIFYKTFVNNKLYKPLLIITIVIALYHFSGKLVCSIYAIDIIKNMTSSESIAYTGMLILDGVTVIGMYFGCLLSKFTKRRSQLLISTIIGILFLFATSFYLYLIKLGLLNENAFVTLALLVIFSLSICCGPIIMSTSVAGEILPLEYRHFCVCVMAVIANVLMATSLKCGPLIFRTFDVHGAFLFYGITSSILLFLTYNYLPETKDKTLQEIQNCLQGDTTKKTSDKNLFKISTGRIMTRL